MSSKARHLNLMQAQVAPAAPIVAHDGLLDAPARYDLIYARSVLNKVQTMMPFRWTINPYRGCRHACVYCFARPTHIFLGLNAGADFHSRIFVKINAPELLRDELARPSWKGETICLGSATDPYQPAETRFRLSRRIIEVLCDANNPLEIITKSPLIVQDLDLLADLNTRTGGKVAVNVSITTMNEAKARLIDPGAPAAYKRMEAVARLSEAGIKTRVFIMPILPGITDDAAELEEVVRAAALAHAYSINGDTLRMARGIEDHYYAFLEQHFPEQRARYARIYSNGRRTFAPERYKEAVKAKIAELRTTYGLDPQQHRIFDNPNDMHNALEEAEAQAEAEQLTLEFA